MLRSAGRLGRGGAEPTVTPSAAHDMARRPYYSGPPSDHFDGRRFFNPGQPPTDRTLREIWRWQSRRAAAKWPARVEVTAAVPAPHADRPRITMVGHATLLIQVA